MSLRRPTNSRAVDGRPLDQAGGGGAEAVLRSALEQAVLAPSGHNTQPWRFRLVGDRVEVLADRTRALPVVDPDDRALVISCGAAVAFLVVALRHAGHTGDVASLPDPADPDLLASIGLGEAHEPTDQDRRLFAAVERRHSHRGAFQDRAVPVEVLTALPRTSLMSRRAPLQRPGIRWRYAIPDGVVWYRRPTRVVLRSFLVLGAVGVLLLAGPAVPAPARAGSAASDQDVAAVLTEQLHAAGIPGGAVVTVTERGGIAAHGVGVTGDGRPVTAGTPFVIGSTTKSFTALAVLQLVDAGKVDLDGPVVDHVPELRLADGEPVSAITVRHLLQHTSGLDDLSGGPVLASAREGTALEAIAELRDARLASSPGETWRYANANYVLAGLVVERASALPYADHLQRAVLDPLGMRDTHVLPHPAVGPGHRYWFGVPVASGPVQRRGVVAAGYLASTARDLGRYLAVYLRDGRALDGTRIVSPDGIRALTTPGPEAHLGPWAGDASARYAMGWMVGGPWTQPAVFHPGNAPDSSAMIALFPDRGLAAATLVPASHELPVPGNPSLTDRISRNSMHAVLGEPVPAATGRWGFYALFDVAAVGLVALAAWPVVRAVRARRRGPVGPVRRWLQPLPTLVICVALATLPGRTAYGWDGVRTWAPDLAVLLYLLTALTAVAAGIRLLTAARATRHGHAASTEPAESKGRTTTRSSAHPSQRVVP